MKKLKEKIKKHIEKRGKGFTLIELLAVIVILGVIILIAVNAVLPQMEKSKKTAFRNEALTYIKAAKAAAVEEQMEEDNGATCYTIAYLNKHHVDKSDPSYEGFIQYDAEDKVWKAYIKNNKYMINGEGGEIDKSSVVKAGTLTETPRNCVDVVPPKGPVCKRATTLHRETCDRTETNLYCRADGYAQGSTIEYGNLGTAGSLATGDAFDCDVNGDGTYDSSTERFYYVTDMNDDIALLIFYNNVNKGVPDNMARSAFHSNSNNSYYGPETAMLELPTTEQWNNISLSSSIRNIVDDSGTVRVNGFSYEGYAARLLTYQEVNNGCYDGNIKISSNNGLSSKCKFLFENSQYSSNSLNSSTMYLETQPDYRTDVAWALYAGNIRLSGANVGASGLSGVRPVIEVPKVDIEI